MDNTEIAWMVEWFEITGDNLVGKLQIAGLTFDDARHILALPADDPVDGAFKIDRDAALRIQSFVELDLDLDSYEYFLLAYARN